MYPFPELTTQLQFLCSPAEYSQIAEQKRFQNTLEFWALLPSYRYAQCPFCGQEYREKANTYTIQVWGYIGLAPNLYIFGQKNEIEKHCNHFLGVREFINLHSVQPLEVSSIDNHEGEVPLVDSRFFRADMKTYVILHALPICRIENNAFVPTYTVFLMTYFTEDPRQNMKHNYQAQQIWAEINPEYRPSRVTSPTSAKPESFDLAQWAERGQLGWLDFTQSALPFRLGKVETLPNIYRDIQGLRQAYIWQRPK